ALELPDVGEPLELGDHEDPPAPDDDSFDPFADADPAGIALPEAAAPLVSDQFAEKAEPEGDDDLDVDVFDDGGDAPAFEPPPPLKPRDNLPGLADAGVGFSNPFARAARSQPSAEPDDEDGSRGFLAAPAEPAPRPGAETMPWGLNRASVM